MAAGDFIEYPTDAECFDLDSYLDTAMPKPEYALYTDFRASCTATLRTATSI
jgi:hypothetical protein